MTAEAKKMPEKIIGNFKLGIYKKKEGHFIFKNKLPA